MHRKLNKVNDLGQSRHSGEFTQALRFVAFFQRERPSDLYLNPATRMTYRRFEQFCLDVVTMRRHVAKFQHFSIFF